LSDATSVAKVYRTRAGEIATVRLTDGSTVTLAPATTVTVRPADIAVSGEAYFCVATHTARPFVVTTRNASVRVLGTRFVVRQYPEELRSRIMVENGRVALQSRSVAERHAVVAERMLALVTDSEVTVTPGVVTREYTAWTSGTLVFDSVSVRDVVTELARAYGVHIRVADSVLARQTINAEVRVREWPLTQVLDAISYMIDAHYTRSGSSYVLLQGQNSGAMPSEPLQRNRFPQPEKRYGR
jgi:transmembrane sensor